MINLQFISDELSKYKEDKEDKERAELYSDIFEFVDVAKNTPLETFCEQLIEEVEALRRKIKVT